MILMHGICMILMRDINAWYLRMLFMLVTSSVYGNLAEHHKRAPKIHKAIIKKIKRSTLDMEKSLPI